MQRRRSTPRSRPDPNSNSNSSSNHHRSSRPPSPTAGIELREQPSHATSSSISHSFADRAAADHAVYIPPTYPSATRVPFADTPLIMKPLVGAMQAWSCVVISVFAIIILSILGLLFRSNNHEMVGGVDDPENGPEVAATIFVAVLVYAGFLVFCGLQGMLHLRETRRGAIALQ